MFFNQQLMAYLNRPIIVSNSKEREAFLNSIIRADADDQGLSEAILKAWKKLPDYPKGLSKKSTLNTDPSGDYGLDALKQKARAIQDNYDSDSSIENIRINAASPRAARSRSSLSSLDSRYSGRSSFSDRDSLITADPFPANKNENAKDILSIEELRAEVLGRLKALKQAFDPSKMRGALTYRTFQKLAQGSYEEWLNPAFMTKARREANTIHDDYHQLSGRCDRMLILLRHHQKELMTLNAVIQSKDFALGDSILDDTMDELTARYKDEKADLHAIVNARRKVVEDALKVYEAASKKLDKINELIQQAAAANEAVVEIKTSPLSRISVRYGESDADVYVSDGADSAVSLETGSFSNEPEEKRQWQTTSLDAHQSRHFTVEYKNKPEFTGKFKEQFREMNPAASSVSEKSKIPHVKLTLETFPKGRRVEAVEAKVNFAMLMARQLLASSDQIPSKKNPIILRGPNKEELQYLWTALMILGKNTPDMRFGSEAIVVRSAEFNPKDELKWNRQYAKNSCFTQNFQNNESLYMANVNDFKQFAQAKFGQDTEKKAVHADVTRAFKSKQREAIEGATENQEDNRTPKP